MKRSYLIFLAAYSLLLACGQDTATVGSTGSGRNAFFDLEAYFSREMARLDSLQPILEKIVIVDGEREEQRVKQTDFADELQVFRKSDINRPSWVDKYQVDSLLENDELEMVRYTALDTTLNTRLLSIRFEEGVIKEILVENRSRSAIARTEQDLQYRPGEGYRIDSRQKTIGASAHQVSVEVSLEQ